MTKSYQEIRPSQFITTFGPGSIVETPGGPVVLKGLGALFARIGKGPDEFEIVDERLSQAELGDGRIFRVPTNAELGEASDRPIYPVHRFPFWSLCAQHRDGYQVLYRADEGCPECPKMPDWLRMKRAGQEAIRFVTACINGHLDEVPWSHLVHRDSGDGCRSRNFRWYGGGRALRLVHIMCPKCRAKANLGEAYGRSWRCHGRETEHGQANPDRQCKQPASIVQRGSANLRTSQLVTALTILDMPERLHGILGGRGIRARLDMLQDAGVLSHEAVIRAARKEKVTADDVAYLERIPWGTIQLAVEQLLGPSESQAPPSLRDAELDYLRNAAIHGAPAVRNHPGAIPMFEVIKDDIRVFKDAEGAFSFRVTPISRLRMVMVQTGYKRLSPDTGRTVSASFKLGGNDWYPGVELFGEGLFIDLVSDELDLDGDRVAPWLTRYQAEQGEEKIVQHPAHVWWHSLSHRLLWALSVDSGYSSAAIRERVYTKIEGDQVTGSGLLLYTVQPGGDGTMGGMISLAGRFGRIIDRALQDVATCSNDPLCEEAAEQGAHGAACYVCLFASETSCEHRNHGLDRLLLVQNQPRLE